VLAEDTAPSRGLLAFVLVSTIVIALPALAGIVTLALQVLGDSSTDFARYDFTRLPQVLLAIGASGLVFGYMYGLVPSLIAGAGVAWLVLTGRKLSLARVVLCVLAGGVIGIFALSFIIGLGTGLAVLVIMLAVTFLLWLVFRPTVAAYKASRGT